MHLTSARPGSGLGCCRSQQASAPAACRARGVSQRAACSAEAGRQAGGVGRREVLRSLAGLASSLALLPRGALAASATAEADPAAEAAALAKAPPVTPGKAAAPASGGKASPAQPSLTSYTDEKDKFSIAVPAEWRNSTGEATNLRRAVAWFPEGEAAGANATNITVLVTNVGADYTRLGSFGNAEQFGTNLVASMDRSFLLRGPFARDKTQKVQRAKLIDTKERDNKYFLEYTVQRPEEEQPRHLLSVVALGYNGRYNRLYTVTGQCLESDVPRYRALLDKSMQSFKSPKPTDL